MTVLAQPDDRLEISAERIGDAASLRSWLAGRWGILFSHPADFTQEQMETDRWVSVLSRSFGERDIAPVALARPGRDLGQGWIGDLAAVGQRRAATLVLEPSAGPLADPATGALRALIARGGPRFAMIIDSNLRCRRALHYRPPAELPSPLEIIGWAVALRKRDRGLLRAGIDIHSATHLSPRRDGLFYRLSGTMASQADGGGSVCGPSRSLVRDSRGRLQRFTC